MLQKCDLEKTGILVRLNPDFHWWSSIGYFSCWLIQNTKIFWHLHGWTYLLIQIHQHVVNPHPIYILPAPWSHAAPTFGGLLRINYLRGREVVRGMAHLGYLGVILGPEAVGSPWLTVPCPKIPPLRRGWTIGWLIHGLFHLALTWQTLHCRENDGHTSAHRNSTYFWQKSTKDIKEQTV